MEQPHEWREADSKAQGRDSNTEPRYEKYLILVGVSLFVDISMKIVF
jgi:hypothetical protein